MEWSRLLCIGGQGEYEYEYLYQSDVGACEGWMPETRVDCSYGPELRPLTQRGLRLSRSFPMVNE